MCSIYLFDECAIALLFIRVDCCLLLFLASYHAPQVVSLIALFLLLYCYLGYIANSFILFFNDVLLSIIYHCSFRSTICNILLIIL